MTDQPDKPSVRDRTNRRNDECARHPQPGDYWHETYTPVLVVLHADADKVVVCRRTRKVGEDRWTWDLGVTETMPRDAFDESLRYDSEGMRHLCYGACAPGSHRWVLDHVGRLA